MNRIALALPDTPCYISLDILMLGERFQRNGISVLDFEHDVICAMGRNKLPNLKQEGDTAED